MVHDGLVQIIDVTGKTVLLSNLISCEPKNKYKHAGTGSLSAIVMINRNSKKFVELNEQFALFRTIETNSWNADRTHQYKWTLTGAGMEF
jgi:hypothetical protein